MAKVKGKVPRRAVWEICCEYSCNRKAQVCLISPDGIRAGFCWTCAKNKKGKGYQEL